MRIATLQFSPQLGTIAPNFSRAESLLMREERAGNLQNLDLLILPELAFTGYAFRDLKHIAPFLEPTAAGPSTRWAARTAQRLKCTVAVGYPEAAAGETGNFNTVFDERLNTVEKGFNSLVVVSAMGEVVAHYRKRFLYYSDESWAEEGDGKGFYAGVLPIGEGGRMVKVAAGICMDINPYKFEAEWTAYEFANHAREARAKLVVVSMAWLTRLGHEEVYGEEVRMVPDMDTVGYWVERFRPLLGSGAHDEEVIVVCGNRTGEEGVAERVGEVRYAGSSCVMGFKKATDGRQGEVRVWDILGRAQEGILIVDTTRPPLCTVQQKKQAWESLADAPVETNGLETALGDPTVARGAEPTVHAS